MNVPSHTAAEEFPDDALVYVDPDTHAIIGLVEWEGDAPKKLPREQTGDAAKKRKKRYYPYCTMRTARHVLWKKRSEASQKLSLDAALQKLVTEPFLDGAPHTPTERLHTSQE